MGRFHSAVRDANEATPRPKARGRGWWKDPKGGALTLLERSLGEREVPVGYVSGATVSVRSLGLLGAPRRTNRVGVGSWGGAGRGSRQGGGGEIVRERRLRRPLVSYQWRASVPVLAEDRLVFGDMRCCVLVELF